MDAFYPNGEFPDIDDSYLDDLELPGLTRGI